MSQIKWIVLLTPFLGNTIYKFMKIHGNVFVRVCIKNGINILNRQPVRQIVESEIGCNKTEFFRACKMTFFFFFKKSEWVSRLLISYVMVHVARLHTVWEVLVWYPRIGKKTRTNIPKVNMLLVYFKSNLSFSHNYHFFIQSPIKFWIYA